MTLSEKGALVDVISKGLEMNSLGVSEWDMDKGPYTKRKRKDTQRGHVQKEVEVGVMGLKPRKTD